MTVDKYQVLVEQRYARAGFVLTQLIETEWRRVLRELDSLDIDSGDVSRAARLIGQYQMLDQLMAALSEGSLSSDYEIEAQWRHKLVERVIEGFGLQMNTPPSSLRRYKSLAQQVAEICGLEVIKD
ncbi:hypothetical protein [Limnoraphis robusta]|uniref:Uncharacterized protein n=1 Tax=Limnoraphis robusta CS-951 TaxID=1637645 RepID=A0A0F5YJP1_9CYAN|nr:hypothetical protein [Limnoraphis robusta]KKD39124.1 hypothetical protein WN50_05225 [Limnoraphis robusta CS-951]